MRLLLGTILSAALLSPAWAGVTATLTFTTPNGTVGPTDSIPIYLTLTLDPSSVALTTDGSGNVTSGLTPADIAANLFAGLPPGEDQTSATNSNLNEGWGCSGTFFTGCSGNPYDYVDNFSGDFSFYDGLNLAPGSSSQWLLATLTPTGGTAPAGTYTFAGPFSAVGFFIQVWDNTYPGGPLHLADVPIADTGNVTFTRTVVDAVPEPGTWAMMLGGLALAAGFKRRQAARA